MSVVIEKSMLIEKVCEKCLAWQYKFQHEFIIFVVKGNKQTRRISTRKARDILSVPRISGNKTIHPTEKPPELITPLILNSNEPGEVVVDCFLGSGPVAAAAIKNGRELFLFE
ncbi:hypothetical protein BRE01_68420 [Brevibacillus reuszeri]|uniref:DNA methylase N-4/N-6 domain-containing protein n=1 Tax=Brevibacillus reuszeri TaxID=54915 RepID=A0ABQ0TZ20_9BACL|nr:DNA methyltransferase [Brevibacillus reuszeri]MED1861632.1 DNA methyltransferase [Brevibacillus reuszeri]GED73140.1 hypothetical protein BRE01_68420 [Brevibacillus reuszeri]